MRRGALIAAIGVGLAIAWSCGAGGPAIGPTLIALNASGGLSMTGGPMGSITALGMRTDCSAGSELRYVSGAWSCSPADPLVFCDGSDGAVTIAADTTLTRDSCYTTLVVNSGHILHTGGFRIFATVSVSGPGTIDNSGGAGASGASGGAGGISGDATGAASQGTYDGGCAGGGGGNGSSSAPTDEVCHSAWGGTGWPDVSTQTGATGGAGDGHSGATSSGVTRLLAQGANVIRGNPHELTQVIRGRSLVFSASGGVVPEQPWHGGAGGGGGGGGFTNPNSSTGGGGGGGGGPILIAAPSILAALVISSNGGAGGAGQAVSTAHGGGGAGGGGGAIWIVSAGGGSYTASITGGAGGASSGGSSAAGATGPSGITYAINY